MDAHDGISSPSDPPGGFVAGSEFGRYLLISELGRGAMGVVVAAYDPQLDRKVALKLLTPRRGDLSRSRQRLQREAQALAKLGHPNVIAVHDVAEQQQPGEYVDAARRQRVPILPPDHLTTDGVAGSPVAPRGRLGVASSQRYASPHATRVHRWLSCHDMDVASSRS